MVSKSKSDGNRHRGRCIIATETPQVGIEVTTAAGESYPVTRKRRNPHIRERGTVPHSFGRADRNLESSVDAGSLPFTHARVQVLEYFAYFHNLDTGDVRY